MKPITIRCQNNGAIKDYPVGTSLLEIANDQAIQLTSPVLAAIANNQLKELSKELYTPQTVTFIDISHPDGMRCYQRGLTFLLQKAVKDILPSFELQVQNSVSNGVYCELKSKTEPFTIDLLEKVRAQMKVLIKANLPFQKCKLPNEEAIALFLQQGYTDKAHLLRDRARIYSSVYYLDGYADNFYGPLLPSTAYLTHFDIVPFHDGFLLVLPNPHKSTELARVIKQQKMFDILQEHKQWIDILQVSTVGQINQMIERGEGGDLIKISEALHEKKYAQIADTISQRGGAVKLILIAGPSSSGKTTTSKRLATQLKVAQFTPKMLEMDNYFVDREKTPLDEYGAFDFDHLHAVDIQLFNEHLQALLAGKRVELPKYNFEQGKRIIYTGNYLQLNEHDVLLVDGIHALNPELTAAIPAHQKFRIYVSALTSVNLDSNNRLSTTDNRLIRRLVRDTLFRGITPSETLSRWQSVRRGEDKNIFPFQEHADVMFNSSLPYEFNLLRHHAEQRLRLVRPNNPFYVEALRLIKFLRYFEFLSAQDECNIPPTSIMREFIGGSSYSYE
ncbi:MAG: nucleoside kinase [Bacteroidales bacterium]